jgi:hypothetical protein
MPFRKVINVDFSSLYPNVMRDFTKDSKFMKELLKRKRLEKLNRLENLNKL